jgi:hypothetical protein
LQLIAKDESLKIEGDPLLKFQTWVTNETKLMMVATAATDARSVTEF